MSQRVESLRKRALGTPYIVYFAAIVLIAFLADRICFEENEAYPPAEHLFVIIDPADGQYVRWLHEQNIEPVGAILATTARRAGQPAIYLVRARIGAQK